MTTVIRATRATAVLLVLLLLVGIALTPWRGLLPSPESPVSWLSQLLDALAFGFVGAAIAERTASPQRLIGGVLLLAGVSQAATFTTSSALSRGSTTTVAWLDGWLWAPGVLAILLLLPALFPSGRPPGRFRALLPAGLAVLFADTALAAYDALPERSLPGALSGAGVVAAVLVGLAGLVSLLVRYRLADPRSRGQIRWLAWVASLLVIVELAVPVLPVGVTQVLLAALPLSVPLAVGLAVLRYGLFDIDLLLSRTLVSLLLSALMLALYVGVVAAIDRGTTGRALTSEGFLATLVVALIAAPVHRLLSRAAHARVWGPASDARAALAELSHRIGSSPSLRDSPRIVAETLAAGLRAPVALVAGGAIVAAEGSLTEVLHEVPVLHSGREVGAVRVGVRPGGALAPREQRLLAEVCVAVGPLLDSLALTEELRREQTRVLEVIADERRRLRRDLHDSLGPTLAGLTLGLDAARSLVSASPADAEASLERLGELAATATAEVRRVVDDLRPLSLDERGLVGAITHDVVLEGITPTVSIRASDLPPLAPQVEEVALRLVSEAVTNVRRHAEAGRCEVSLEVAGQDLQVTVDDDGRGLGTAGEGSGVGLVSMRARVARVGGTLDLAPSPLGGVRVRATLPRGVAG